MTNRTLTSFGVVAAAVAVALFGPSSIEGQGREGAQRGSSAATSWTPPRTPDGHPDLQGVWVNNSATPLERPKAFEGRALLTDLEVADLRSRYERLFKDGNADFAAGDAVFLAALANPEEYKNPDATASSLYAVDREFDNRTSLIVDPSNGRIPSLTPQAQQRQEAVTAVRRRPSGPEDLTNPIRCITWGVPRLAAGNPYTSHYQILQTSDYVVLNLETDVRIIPLNGRPHLSERIRLWNGDSVGRWEGNTLVVDTINFSPQSNFRGSSENLHLIERFTRVAPDRISYRITIDDPTTWTRSWTVEIRLKLTEDGLYEYACHEGSYEVMRGILAAARIEERK